MANYNENLNSCKNVALWGTIFGVDNNTGIMNWFLKIELQVDEGDQGLGFNNEWAMG